MGTGLRAKLGIIALVYVIEGFPMGVYAEVLPVFLRRNEVSLTAIGILSALSLAWSIKALWSPLIDRYGERRSWISGAMLVMAVCLGVLAASGAVAFGPLLWCAIALYCAASATQDIAIDAYTIGLVDPGEEGPANSMRVVAYRVGLIAAGGGLLFLPRWIEWQGTFAAAAVASIAMAAAVRICRPVAIPAAAQRETWRPLLRWLDRPHVLAVAGFVLLYRVGDRAMGPMVRPFWVDRGFANEEIALVSNTLGSLAFLTGAIAGGWAVSRWGIGRALWILGGLALASNLTYAGVAWLPGTNRGPVYVASIVESLSGGLASIAFMSYLMRICEREHAAVQYAILTGVYALAGAAVAVPSGWLVERMGYAAYFGLTALYALPALAFIPRARRWLEATAS